MPNNFVAVARIAQLMAILGATSYAADLFPLYQKTTWQLASPGIPNKLIISSESYEDFTTVRRARLKIASPWVSYALIVRSSDSGVKLEGFGWDQLMSRYSEPEPFFPVGAVGTKLKGDAVQATLTSTTATVTTPSGKYTGVSIYEVIFNGSDRQIWYVKPGIGIVQFGEGPWAFKLESVALTGTPAPAVPAAAHACPAIGAEPNPAATTDFSAAARETAQAKAVQMGANHVVISTSWIALEPAPGKYDFALLKESIDRAVRYGLKASVILKTIDTSRASLPADLAGKAWNDPIVIARFQALLNQLVPLLKSQVKWLHLGNEVDAYLSSRPAEVASYQQFFQAGAQLVKILRPDLPVSLVFAYDTYRQTNSVFTALQGGLPHIAFTYYAVRSPTALNASMQRGSENAPLDLADMLSAAQGRDLVLSEVGYSSATEAGSTLTRQAQFYTSMYSAVQTAGPQIKALNFAFLSDIPPTIATQLGTVFGAGNTLFVKWLAALGITNASGVNKPAAESFSTGALLFRSGPVCR